jgi:hypothetical protein
MGREGLPIEVFDGLMAITAGWTVWPRRFSAWCYRQNMAYPLAAAQAHLGDLVAETRQSHRPVNRKVINTKSAR